MGSGGGIIGFVFWGERGCWVGVFGSFEVAGFRRGILKRCEVFCFCSCFCYRVGK